MKEDNRMSKPKTVTFDIARIAAQKEDKKITRIKWGKGVYLTKGTTLFFMMRTTNNKIITYVPTDGAHSAIATILAP